MVAEVVQFWFSVEVFSDCKFGVSGFEGFEGVLRVLKFRVYLWTAGARFSFDLRCKFLSFVPSLIRCCWLTFVYPSRGMREMGESGLRV